MTSHRPYHHGDLRAALLRAAVDTIAEGGPAALSLRRVARRAGVSHTAAAYHFGDKAGLLTAVVNPAYFEIMSTIETTRNCGRPALEPLGSSTARRPRPDTVTCPMVHDVVLKVDLLGRRLRWRPG